MPPRHKPIVIPRPEQRRPERQTPGLQEGDEAPAEARAVHVEEVAVAPVGLEVCFVGQRAEFGELVLAVVVPAASDFVDEGDVRVEVCGGFERGEGVGVVFV